MDGRKHLGIVHRNTRERLNENSFQYTSHY